MSPPPAAAGLEPRLGRWVRFWSLRWLKLKLPLVRRRARRLVIEPVEGRPFVVLPEVFNPALFRGGRLLAQTVASSPYADPDGLARPCALDMGTGSGVGAVFAAARGYRTVAVDLNDESVRCARINALLNRMEDRIDVRGGDLFQPVLGERFHLVLFNPPFYRGQPRDQGLDLAWRSPDAMERFADGLEQVLEPGGRALILLSTEGEPRPMLSALQENGFAIEIAQRRHYGNEIMTVYAVSHRPSGSGQ